MSVHRATSRIALAVALLVTLDGCIAAVIPVLAGAAGARSQLGRGSPQTRRIAVTTPAPEETMAPAPAPVPATNAQATPPVLARPILASTGGATMGPPAPSPFETAGAVAREPYRTAIADVPRVTATAAPAPSQPRAVAPAPVRKLAAAPPPRAARVRTRRAQAPPPAALVTQQTEVAAVPAPGIQPTVQPAHVRGDYADFARFALAQAQPMSGGAPRTSVVYDPASPLEAPKFLACDQLAPAVLIDLDPAAGAFSPAHAGGAAPGLGDALTAVRAAGLVVLWATDLPVTLAPEVYRTLRASGLDAEGTDRLLLNRTSDERKELRKRAAAADYCIVAVAGDKRGDFAELYDYLRNPAAAAALEPRFGAGWFLVPPALGAN